MSSKKRFKVLGETPKKDPRKFFFKIVASQKQASKINIAVKPFC